MNYRKIVWLASYPKSGNTWFRAFVESYIRGKDVDINNLLCSVSDDIATRHDVGDGSDTRVFPVDIQQLTRHMALLRLVRGWETNKPHEDMCLFVKTHAANAIVNGVTLLPEQLTKSTIHIVRDPRDVVISFAKHMGLSIDVAIECMTDKHKCLSGNGEGIKVDDFISSWKYHTNSYCSGDLIRIKTFRYEDMCSDPINTFANMLKHAGIEPDLEKVKQSLEDVKISKLRKKEELHGFIEASQKNDSKFFGKGGSNWRNILTTSQSYKVEKLAGNFMKKYGYTTERKAA
jgi:hypothetical protein